jgi:hypothetical protein
MTWAMILSREGCFAGLCWPDARRVAAAICQELVGGELSGVDKSGSAADRLLNCARDVLARTDGVVWRDKDRVVRAFTIAATTLGI